MLSVAEIRSEVAKVVYKPDWWLSVEERGFEDPWLRVLARVPNAYEPQGAIDLGIDSPIPPIPDVEYLHQWLIWRLICIESHEAREFYLVNGVRIFDPHRQRDRV